MKYKKLLYICTIMIKQLFTMTVNEKLMECGNGTPTVQQMYELNRDFKQELGNDPIVEAAKSSIEVSALRYDAKLGFESIIKASETTKAAAKGNEWYTIPPTGCTDTYYFLLVSGKNGGTKNFSKEILMPVADLLSDLSTICGTNVYLCDAQFDNADDIHYFVVVADNLKKSK